MSPDDQLIESEGKKSALLPKLSIVNPMRRRPGTLARPDLRKLGEPIKGSPHLPLVHVTSVGAGREIVESGGLETRHCKVFKKQLLYFFILRPAYRLVGSEAKTDQINRFPFVFIVSPENLDGPYHVYPFDTGAAADGIFDDRADEWVYLEDYELEPDFNAVNRHIGWAFGTSAAYLEGDLLPGLIDPLPQWQDVGRSYIKIAGLASSNHNRPDKRASAIEVAYRDNVPLKGNIKFAILPKQYLEEGTDKNSAFISKLTAAGIDWEVYDWQPNITPDECRDQISRIAREYYKKAGIL